MTGKITGCGGKCCSWSSLEVLARHLDLVVVRNVDHIVAVLYHQDLARHPSVQLLSEGFQDRHIRFASEFVNHEATRYQVTQHLDWQLHTVWYPGVNTQQNAPGAARINDPPWANHTTAATCDSASVGCSKANTLAGRRRTNFPPMPRSRPPQTPPLLLRNYLTTCPTVGFRSTGDLAYWAIRNVFRASARTKAVWAAVWYSSRPSKLE